MKWLSTQSRRFLQEKSISKEMLVHPWLSVCKVSLNTCKTCPLPWKEAVYEKNEQKAYSPRRSAAWRRTMILKSKKQVFTDLLFLFFMQKVLQALLFLWVCAVRHTNLHYQPCVNVLKSLLRPVSIFCVDW